MEFDRWSDGWWSTQLQSKLHKHMICNQLRISQTFTSQNSRVSFSFHVNPKPGRKGSNIRFSDFVRKWEQRRPYCRPSWSALHVLRPSASIEQHSPCLNLKLNQSDPEWLPLWSAADQDQNWKRTEKILSPFQVMNSLFGNAFEIQGVFFKWSRHYF